MFTSHFKAGSGVIAVQTREEARLLTELCKELPAAEIALLNAPAGDLLGIVFDAKVNRVVRKKEPIKKNCNLADAYEWLAAHTSRVLFVQDAHMLLNNPGTWRALSEALPRIRHPEGEGKRASMVIFVAPHFQLSMDNPLAGNIPILTFDTPNRAALRTVAASLRELPEGREGERVVDALCGLPSEIAEQVCAENLVANEGRWNPDTLNEARRRAIRVGGLEIWKPVTELGGLGGLKEHIEDEVLPWIYDDTLAIRRILGAGLPGTGKSYFARWLAHRLGCECARLSVPSLKGGLVGMSEQNLRRALRTVDTMAAESPLVMVIDEIDTIARDGSDGGTSAGMFAEILTWLQESRSKCIVVATLNRLDLLDAALHSRFHSSFFFDLPSVTERRAVAEMHYRRCGCPLDTVNALADITDGFSNREIAESVIPSIARLSNRNPTHGIVNKVCASFTPASKTQADQLAKMRAAAAPLRKANDTPDTFEVN